MAAVWELLMMGLLGCLFVNIVSSDTSTRTVCPSREYDIVFLVDASTSIGPENWVLILEFVATLVNQTTLTVGKDHSRVGLVRFTETAESIFYLNSFDTKPSVIQNILNTTLKNGDTNIAAAMRLMRTEQFTASHGDRQGAPNIGIVISDGYSNKQEYMIEEEGKKASEANIHMFALGIGGDVLVKNLRLLSSPSSEENKNYWVSADYHSLSELTLSMTVLLNCTEYPAPCGDEPCDSQACRRASTYHADHTIVCECSEGFTAKYCYPDAVNETSQLDDKCSIVAEVDRPTVGPQLHMICPNYGPESGGTDVHIWGNGFDDVERTVVEIGQFPCDIIFSNNTFIQCLTTTNKGTDTTGVKLPLTVKGLVHPGVTMPEAFTYKLDPVAHNIYPQNSFVAGGTTITVIGENLDSVAGPILQLTMHISDELGGDKLFPSECRVINSTVAECPAPEVKVPDHILPFLGDNCRYVEPRGTAAHGATTEHPLDVECTVPVVFFAGLKFDGINLPETSLFSVFPNPTVDVFPNGGLRLYNPAKESSLDIYGNDFDRGATASDYVIKIGKEYCSNIVIHSNAINCIPPRIQPVPTEERFSREGAPRVEVNVGNYHLTPGYLKYITTKDVEVWDKPEMRYSVIAMGIILGILLMAVFCRCLMSSVRRMIERQHLYSISKEYDDCGQLNEAMSIMNMLSEDVRRRLESCLIPSDRLVLGEVIGTGQFGIVHLGVLRKDDGEEKTVAVKSIKDRGALSYDVIEFLKEATLMKQFNHPNILPLLGVVIRDNSPYVITPFMENQDLKNYLRVSGKDLTTNQLLKMARDVANGMLCLASRKYVHRDLAARNCMVNARLDVKIADFGLSRDMYNADYYRADVKRCPLPIRWMAPESLATGLFTIKSDVWSYGVVLWETMSLGGFPYVGISNLALRRRLKAGHRLVQPELATDEVYKLMTDCWCAKPKLRPSFAAIVTRLTRILTADYQKLPDVDYLTMPDTLGNIYLELVPGVLRRTESTATNSSDGASEESTSGHQHLEPISVANLISYFASSQQTVKKKRVDETGYLIPVHR